jgi:hypothetical protein
MPSHSPKQGQQKQDQQKVRPWAVFAPVAMGEGEKDMLHQVGVAFPHKEGGGFNIPGPIHGLGS